MRPGVSSDLLELTPLAQLSTDAARYVFDIRASKQPFQLTSLMTIMKDIASSELGQTTARPLDEINALLAQLAQDTATTLSAAMDAEHVVKRELCQCARNWRVA